jgi:hypothetical protein
MYPQKTQKKSENNSLASGILDDKPMICHERDAQFWILFPLRTDFRNGLCVEMKKPPPGRRFSSFDYRAMP